MSQRIRQQVVAVVFIILLQIRDDRKITESVRS